MNTATRAESTALTTAGDPAPYQVDQARVGAQALVLDPQHFQNLMAVANMMASGRSTVPKHLRGNPGDCLAVTMQAVRWGMDPFAVAQKTFLVNDVLGYEAQLVSAVINSSGLLKERLRFEWFGDWEKIVGKFKTVESKTKKDDNGHPKTYIVPDWKPEDERGLGVKVWTTIKGEDVPRERSILMAQARTRNSTLWTEDPQQQIAYLAEKRWARLHTPDVLLGVYTRDELEEAAPPKDMGAADVVGTAAIPAKLLADVREAADKGSATFNKFWKELLLPERNLLAGEIADLKRRTEAARTVDNTATGAPAATPAPATAAAQADADGVIKPTLAKILEQMAKASDPDTLDVYSDLLRDLDDEGEKAKGFATYQELRAKFQ